MAKSDIQKYKYRLIIALYPSNVFSPYVLLKVQLSTQNFNRALETSCPGEQKLVCVTFGLYHDIVDTL